jgi:hypothetical protein
MKPCSKSPNYLVRNPYSYCFRMTVPKDLQKVVGKKELRYSLKTGYLNDAKYKARILAGQVQRLFQHLRKGKNERNNSISNFFSCSSSNGNFGI